MTDAPTPRLGANDFCTFHGFLLAPRGERSSAYSKSMQAVIVNFVSQRFTELSEINTGWMWQRTIALQ